MLARESVAPLGVSAAAKTTGAEAGPRALQSISCVVPCYNEAENLERLLPQLSAALALLAPQWEIVLVDDGSADATGERMARWTRQPGVRALQLSRNFGKEAALTAGLQAVRSHEAELGVDRLPRTAMTRPLAEPLGPPEP